MDGVKRYKLHMFDRYPADGSGERETHADMRECLKGKFVKFEDHEATLAALREEQRLLNHDIASFLETTAKVCELLGIDTDDAKHADGKPSDVLFTHATALQQRLTAVEQRNEFLEAQVAAKDVGIDFRDALINAVRMSSTELLAAWVPSDWEAKRRTLLSNAKPTESGASE